MPNLLRTYRLLSLLPTALVLCGGLPVCAEEGSFSEAARRADFKTFCEQFQENYAYLDRRETPWKTWSVRYADAIGAATTPQAYAAVLESALDELHDFHAEVRSPNPHRWLPVPTFADVWVRPRGEDAALVIAVRKGSDAERAGIVPGDEIVQVDGTSLREAVTARLTPAVNNASVEARQWAVLSLLTGRADEERHFTLKGRDGKTRQVSLPLLRRFEREPGPLSFQQLPNSVGYIRFHNSLGDMQTVAAFDAALETLRSTRGLILDLRDVPSGGNSSVALGVLGRFVGQMLPYQRHRIPNYGQGDIERNWLEMVAPRGPFTYKAPVVVLVNHWTGSMGEGMAIGMDAMHRARVIGTEMAHLGGAVSDFRLPQTGMDVAFATEQIYHVNGTPRHQWVPPVVVAPSDRVSDAILERGVAELERQLHH